MSKILLAFVFALALTPVVARAQDSGADAQTYLGFQVDKEAHMKAGVAPQYPPQLRAANVNGEVVVQYVVDERGAPQMPSFTVLKSTNAEFTESVRRSVAGMVFFPAEIQGKKVRQLVQQPFKFVATR